MTNAKIYTVTHRYDVDGGFGDAVPTSKVLFVTASREIAERFIEKFAKPHIYEKPYSCLFCGDLTIKEEDIVPEGTDIDSIIDRDEMWWLDTPQFYDDDEDDE